MPLTPGTKLGTFEITGLLGKGGMGEVYRARDSKLGRDVAIKVLPPQLAEDAEGLERFKREAKLVASLDHPNICTVYEIGREGDTRFIVMQLVEGDTLDKRIAKRPLSVEEAMPVFCQIAEALDVAHKRGIVHRDLKPGNIMLDQTGNVRILDFGVAKDMLGAAKSDKDSISDFFERSKWDTTSEGEVIGTPAYMSPEQARGQAIDRRTDIWAFGCCVYATLTGQRAFAGQTVQDTLSDILTKEPDWDKLPAEVPEALRILLRRCLVKETTHRLKDAGDIAATLEEICEELKRSAQRPVSEAGAHRSASKLGVVMGGAALAICIVVGGLLFRVQGTPPADRLGENDDPSFRAAEALRPTYMPIALPADQPLMPATIADTSLVLSPDGSLLMYRGMTEQGARLILRRLGGLESVVLDGTEGAQRPFFSPDSKWLGFVGTYDGDRMLVTMSIEDGSVRPVVSVPIAFPSHWAHDGQIYYVPGYGEGIMRIPAQGGEPEIVTTLQDGEMGHFSPFVIPDSATLLYTSFTAPNVESSRLWVYDMETETSRVLLEQAGGGRYISTGHIIYATLGRLMAVPFDLETLSITGRSFDMSEERMSHPDSTPRFDIAASGTLAYAPSDTSADDVLTLSWIDMEGNEQPLRFLRRRYREIEIAPNGRDALVAISEGNTSHIWLLDLERETSMPLTADLNSNSDPIWLGDGPEFVFSSNRDGKWGLYQSSVIDSEHVEILYDVTDGTVIPTSSSSDGHIIIFTNYAGGNSDLLELSLEGTPTVRPLLNTKHDEWIGRLSPDGKWLAYTSDESGEDRVYLRSYPSMTGKIQLSVGFGLAPLWSPDGKTIYYVDQEDMIWAVPMTFDPQPRPDSPQLIYDQPVHRWSIHPDGDRFLVVKVLGNDWRNMGGREIVVVENWFQEVLRRESLEFGSETN